MILLLGPTDVGKSTLALRLLRAWPRAYLLDLDPGQGDLPGAFTLFRAEGGWLTPIRRYLIGSPSPKGQEARAVVGALRLARLIPRGLPAVADTDGLLDPGFRLLQLEALLSVAYPLEAWVLGSDLLYQALAFRRDLRLRRLKPLPEAVRKGPTKRQRRRLERLLAHFQGARPRVLPLPRPLGPYLYALLDGEGFLLGYARLLAWARGEGLFLTPVRGSVARLEVTRLLLPNPALPG